MRARVDHDARIGADDSFTDYHHDKNVEPLYAARASEALAALSRLSSPFRRANAQNAPRRGACQRRTPRERHWSRRRSRGARWRRGWRPRRFVAATYLRGIPVVQVPTSLVAMIDAAIGGKTGVDVPAGQESRRRVSRAVGHHHRPGFARDLPARELRSGMAEALKHGAIADAGYFDRTAAMSPRFATVARDESADAPTRGRIGFDQVGRRELGPARIGAAEDSQLRAHAWHAVEVESGYQLRTRRSHRHCMVLEAQIGERIGVTQRRAPLRDSRRHSTTRGSPRKRTSIPRKLIARTYGDKKKVAGRVEYSLPSAIGRFDKWTTPLRRGCARGLRAGRPRPGRPGGRVEQTGKRHRPVVTSVIHRPLQLVRQSSKSHLDSHLASSAARVFRGRYPEAKHLC